MNVPGRTAGTGLAGRLLAALALVVTVGGITAWLVARAVGPSLFHQHLTHAGLEQPDAAVQHAEEAFRSASGLALAVAITASVLTSLAVSVFLTQRIVASLRTLARAATRIAAGDLDARVEAPRLGVEFEDLSLAFNDMAHQLARADAVRERLLADVAHELRTPVAILAAHLEGLEDGVTTLTPEVVGVLREQGTRLTRLAADLAAVTRAESGSAGLHLLRLAPAELLTRAARAARDRYAAAGVNLEVVVEPGVVDVLVDPDRFDQVLGNLVDNALRHTPGGGGVLLAAGDAGDGAVRIAVTDTGEGIDPAHLPHLFERFYRVDTARDRGHGGSGIGLAIVRALVAAHGGTVAVTSAGLGTGTRFEILLPAAPTPSP